MDILARGMAASAESKADLAVNMVSDFPNGLHYKGKVNELSDLPASADIGDAYTVVNENNREYAWDGSEWSTIGPDLDAYALKSELAPVATSGDYDDLDDKPLEKAEGSYSVQQIVDAEGGQALALGKWSFAEGRGNNFEVSYSSSDYANSKLTVATKSGNPQAYQVRKNAILWVQSPGSMGGAWYYVTADNHSSSHRDSTTLTLDAQTRTIYDGDGTSASHIVRNHSWENIDGTWTIKVYMGAAAASNSHTEGNFNNTVWLNSDTELNEANVNRSHAEGSRTIVAGYCAHGEGENTQAIGGHSHTEGLNTKAMADCGHAEGNDTVALTANSHAEGEKTVAGRINGNTQYVNAHAQGSGSKALGNNTFAGGYHAQATNDHALAHGFYVTADNGSDAVPGRGVFGKYNTDRTDTLFEIGNGSSSYRSNAFEVHYDGSATVQSTLNSEAVTTDLVMTDRIQTNDATGINIGRYIAFGPGVKADITNQVAIGEFNTTHKDAIAVSRFTLTESVYCNNLLIRIGQYADNGLVYTLYNPQLKRIDNTPYDYNIGEHFNYTALIKAQGTDGGTSEYWTSLNAINKVADGGTVDGYPAIRINTAENGWGYLLYRLTDVTLPAGTYELSIMSSDNNILQMPQLAIYSDYWVSINNNEFNTTGKKEYAFTVGNGTNLNRQSAFAVDKDGNARVQSGIYIGDTYIDEDKLQRLLALLDKSSDFLTLDTLPIYDGGAQ